MAPWFLIMAFKCLHHVTWPLLALVYPMCASVQAIETDSYEETKHLISYWILLSLTYLFEYAFMSLLPWFQLWMYIKLMFVFWLTIPDFGRASYVYNSLISSMKLLWRKWFFEKDNFLMHAEIYMKENGTEALEKLIASKNTMCRPDAEAINEIIDTDDKEMAKTNGERLQTEEKGIKDMGAIEKIEIPATKQDIPVMSNTVPSQIASSAKVETKGTAEIDTCGGEVPQRSTQKEVQKKWTCVLCLLTVTYEKTLKDHLNGKKHRAALLKQKDAEMTNKILATDNKEILKLCGSMVYQKVGAHSAWVKKNTVCRPDAAVRNEIIAADNKEMLRTNGERLQIEHKDIKNLEAIGKNELPVTKQDIPVMPIIGPSPNASSTTVETKGTTYSDIVDGEVPRSSTLTQKEVQKEWTCAFCLLTVASEKDLNCHLNGKKHRAACEAALKGKKQPALQKLQIYQPKVEVKQKSFSNMLNSNVKNGDGIVNKGLKGTAMMDHKVQKLQNFNFHIIRPSPSTQAVKGPTPFGRPMSSPIGVPFPYHSGATPFIGPTPPLISVPFPYYGPEGSRSPQSEFTYFIPNS